MVWSACALAAGPTAEPAAARRMAPAARSAQQRTFPGEKLFRLRTDSGVPASSLPAQPFFASPGQRVALARERFFDQGERPSGLVSEAVIQSWTRCLSARRQPGRAVAFEPVTRNSLHAALERNRGLLQAAGPDIQQLELALLGTASRVLLADAHGVIVHATPGEGRSDEPVLALAARLGVNLSEAQVGTNAPAVVMKTGQAVTVMGAEHYFECVRPLYCAAAPIHDGQGRLAGVLDITVEARPFSFDAAALVGVYATMIENRLLQAGARGQLVLQFQVSSSMLGSPLEALVGIDGSGRLAWHNGTAQRLLGLARFTPEARHERPDAETLFGASVAQLLARHDGEQAAPLRLPNGLTVWLRARLAGDAAARPADVAPPPEAAPEPATLDRVTAEVITRTLAECGGNISRAARRLGVSRGLLYRRLQRG